MTLPTISTPISSTGYATEPQAPSQSVPALAGHARRRLDQVAPSERVNVEWHVSQAKLDALLAFMRLYAMRGQKFVVTILQEGFPGPCCVSLVPDSLKVSQRVGAACSLSATLIYQPATSSSAATDEGILSAYAAYGDGVYPAMVALDRIAGTLP